MAFVRLKKFVILCFAGALLIFGGVERAQAVLLGPTPYLSSADSPFNGTSFSYFHLEDFEDAALNTPGVTANAGTQIGFPGPFTDSVDADDGSIDGSGVAGHSFFHGSGFTGVTFTFDEIALGVLPTHVGIVWTDGVNDVVFEAFDGTGGLIGAIGPIAIAQPGFTGSTSEDSFFGVIDAGGIGSIRVSHTNTSFAVEVDHLQYGFDATLVSEPGAFAILGAGLAGVFVIRRRRVAG